jgi:glycosyltransferase involved in cell wall biosynthesis
MYPTSTKSVKFSVKQLPKATKQIVMENSNLVSIVVNCHNSEQFIKECITSIMEQSYENFEIIIWDNNSDDLTGSIVRGLSSRDARIKYFRGENFLPLGAARNRALAMCNGDWIAFLDSDDLWACDFLADQMAALAGKENSTFGFGFVTEFFQNSDDIKNFHIQKQQVQTETSIFDKLLKGNFIYFSSLVISREELKYLKNFKEEYKQAEDYELLLRLAYRFNAIQTGHVYYRIHENNMSKRQTAELYVELLSTLRNYLNYKRAKISFAFNIAKFAIFCHKSKKYALLNETISSRKYNLVYLSVGLGILFTYRIVRFMKIIGKKLLLV